MPPGGGFIPAKGWLYPPKGVVSSPQWVIWGGIAPLGWFCPPFSVVLSPIGWVGGGGLSPFQGQRGMAHLYVNLEPQYRNTSSGMEVGEVMEGEGTTYHSVFYFKLLFVYVLYRMSDLAGDNFRNGV